jgi:hypothetical protein
MRRLALSICNVRAAPISDPETITVGLVILISASFYPDVPAVTAMALVALGATNTTLARFRATAAIMPVALMHVATYGGLYAIFVGASLQAATIRPMTAFSIAAVADIALSVMPVTLALQRVWYGLLRDLDE